MNDYIRKDNGNKIDASFIAWANMMNEERQKQAEINKEKLKQLKTQNQ